MSLPVAILAGGLGTRLLPVTKTVPKALVEINGEPFISHQLRLLRANSIQRVVVCAGYLGEMIQEYVGDGRAFGLHVEYSFDGPQLLGTAGALHRALPMLGGPFFTLYGDSYLPCHYAGVESAFRSSGKLGLMTVYRNEGQGDVSNVEMHDGEIRVYSKTASPAMRHIDYGLGAFQPAAFDRVSPGEVYDLAKLYQSILAEGQLASYEVPERFYEIGSFSGQRDLSEYLQRAKGAARS